MLFVVTLDAGYVALATIAVANTVVSLFHYLRAIAPMYFGSTEQPPTPRLGWGSSAATTCAVFAVVLLAIAMQPWLDNLIGATLLPTRLAQLRVGRPEPSRRGVAAAVATAAEPGPCAAMIGR